MVSGLNNSAADATRVRCPLVQANMCGEAWQAEREREGRDRQHWSAGEVPRPGGACGVAPWSLCGAPAARRATGEP